MAKNGNESTSKRSPRVTKHLESRMGTKFKVDDDPKRPKSLSNLVDELYHKIFVLTFFKLANFFWKKGDEKTIDGLGPNGVSWIISKSSSYVSLFQSGYLFHYAFAMLGGLVIILTWFLYY